jgi:hypothetical protein
MQSVYYSLMPKLLVFLLCAAALLQAPTAQQAPKTWRDPYVDSHEGVIIGVDPWTSANRYKEKFPKKSPFTAGGVGLHLSLRNNNEKGVKVNLQNIRLILQLDEDHRQELAPLTADDVAEVVFTKKTKDPTLRRSPLPIPLPTSGVPKEAHDSNWTQFRDTCQNAAVPSSVIGAHEEVQGLVYFDIRGELDLLQGAKLYVPNLITMDDNEPISYFEIELGHAAPPTDQ